MALATNLKKFRQKKGWSQRSLAEKASISQPFISAIESGEKDATSKVLIRLALALGVTVAELLGDEKSTGTC
jgi:transcriptional regulator with XRE-family HTH domain